jgi:hypothetical protein
MHGWFSWGHTVWMTIAWLTAVGLLLTLVWSIVLSASVRFQERKGLKTVASADMDTDDDTQVEENTKAA